MHGTRVSHSISTLFHFLLQRSVQWSQPCDADLTGCHTLENEVFLLTFSSETESVTVSDQSQTSVSINPTVFAPVACAEMPRRQDALSNKLSSHVGPVTNHNNLSGVMPPTKPIDGKKKNTKEKDRHSSSRDGMSVSEAALPLCRDACSTTRRSGSHAGRHGVRAPNKRKNGEGKGDTALADMTRNANGASSSSIKRRKRNVVKSLISMGK